MTLLKCSTASLGVAALILVGAGCAQSLSGPGGDSKRGANLSDDSDLLVFDESIPVSSDAVYELLYEDIEAITEDSDVVFVGRVVGYRQRVMVVPPSAGMVAVAKPDWEIVSVYDGIVMEADEVLLGEMPEPESRITLGVRALQETLDGTSRSRITEREVHLFREGIKNMGAVDPPRYLVYAGPSVPGTKEHGLGLYWISTRGGVVQVYGDGSLGQALGDPFLSVLGTNEDGEARWVAHDHTLQDARDAAELSKRGIEDTTGPPEEQTTDLEEHPATVPDDSSEQVDPGDGTTPGTGGGGGGADTGDGGVGGAGDGDSGNLGETQDGDGRSDAGDPSSAGSPGADSLGAPDAG